MNMKTKQAVLDENLKGWLETKPYTKERRVLTAQLATTLKINPRSVGRSMKRRQLRDKSKPERRGRPRLYTKDVDSALYVLWEAMDYPCAENISPVILDEYIHALVKDKKWTYSLETKSLVRGMSQGTMKQKIALWREKAGTKRGYSSTTPSPLKLSIPIRKSHTWVSLPAGYLQLDSVVHCGDRLTNDVVYSVGSVDFRTYWSEYTTQWNKGEQATRESLATLRERFPFPWIEIHPDTGNEFINYHVKRWVDTNGIMMTRSEPYKKNDNMCIEERNNTIARKHLGYARLADVSLVPLTTELLRVACVLHNHFRPVRRMVTKERIGARWKRTFETVPKTPYQRVLENPDIAESFKQTLRNYHTTLNPLYLKRELDTLKHELEKKLAK